jgi:ribosomal protein S1
MVFLGFVASHRPGSSVDGTVEEFTSHGAFVRVGEARCYMPLSAMGDPPPRAARDVVTKGETRTFVVQAFDPPRRGIELAIPEFAKVSGAPSEETVEQEIKRTKQAPAKKAAAAKKEPAVKKAPAKRTTKKAAAAAAAAAAAEEPTFAVTVADVGDEHGESPVKKKAPAKKKAAAVKKEPAPKKAAAKKAAAPKKTVEKKAAAPKKAATKKSATKKAAAKKPAE